MATEHNKIILKIIELTQHRKIEWTAVTIASGMAYDTIINEVPFSLFYHNDNKVICLLSYPDDYPYQIDNINENESDLLDDLYKAIIHSINTEKDTLEKKLYEKTYKAVFNKDLICQP